MEDLNICLEWRTEKSMLSFESVYWRLILFLIIIEKMCFENAWTDFSAKMYAENYPKNQNWGSMLTGLF